MTLDALKTALDALDEKSCCAGTYRLSERLALALPDGDVGAVDDARFVEWLLEHSEPAPFGEGGKTKIDKTVRHAYRLEARGKVDVAGFDPADIIGEIEAALSPRTHLKAMLTDVLVYPEGGKFERHKDTPRTESLIGTLVVGLPIAHTGGAFVVDDGRGEQVFDWSGAPDPTSVKWVALYSDVDHQIEPVLEGARVTLVYSLHRTDTPREDPTWKARAAKLRGAIAKLDGQAQWPVMIACTRHVVTDETKQTQPIESLRGSDRDIAELLTEAGYDVGVRACVTATPSDEQPDPARFPTELWSISRLKKPLTAKDIASFGDVVTFADSADADEDYDLDATNLGPKILDDVVLEQWVVRKNAAATLIHESEMFSDSGYFGNEGYEAYIYTLAALEVTKKKSTAKPTASART